MGATEEILALEERLRLADESAEPDTSAVFDELLAEDVLFVQPEGNRTGKAGVLQGHRPPRKRVFSRVANSELEMTDLGSTVVVSCRTDYEIGARSFALRAMRVWRRTGRGWHVGAVAMMEVPKPPAVG